MSLCLIGGGVTAKIAVAAFTLAWLHTIEHTRWQEDWVVQGDRLAIVAARVENSGAGMDPPEGAVKVGDFWQWHPQVPPLPEVVMRRAPMAGDWHLCAGGTCHAFGHWLPATADPVTMKPCPQVGIGIADAHGGVNVAMLRKGERAILTSSRRGEVDSEATG